MKLDLTLSPKPENQQRAISAGSPLRIYESSQPGLVSIFVAGDLRGPAKGLRLDREQVASLSAALDHYLAETAMVTTPA